MKRTDHRYYVTDDQVQYALLGSTTRQDREAVIEDAQRSRFFRRLTALDIALFAAGRLR